MSRESAIEAIEKFLRDWAADGPIMTFRSAADAVVLELAEHGFVSLDDVAEGWVKDEMWSATIQEVLDGRAEKEG